MFGFIYNFIQKNMNDDNEKTVEGVLQNWNSDKGFGFISSELEKDIFCHIRHFREFNPQYNDGDIENGMELKVMYTKGEKGLVVDEIIAIL